ncbi:type II toxin-antitoxin system SpoIISA family toxin [Shouchella lonarensis]|uniref:Stage II sporulation protein SA n=1 Tax=Shouchella lonarensis TaxID=1464122 RepID=A0A1G6J4W6_9BACI|nr:type II toxin-antitoxin system SpoIISA family toxin [Shouchella lonarensis]SDC13683.1 stage II sporulation protein SA [Shouchella lonarensis]
MLLLYQIIVWVTVLGLSFYVFASWRWEEKTRKKLGVIRKIWYALFIVGAALAWTLHPYSLFDRWHHYVIVACVFVIIDAFIFLSAYIQRIGSSLFTIDTGHLIEQNDQVLGMQRNKLKAFFRLLKNDAINVYFGGQRAYITGVREILTKFAEKTEIEASVFPYMTQADKDHVLLHFRDRSAVGATLERQDVYYGDKEKLVYIPVILQGESHVIKLSSNERLTEFDALLFASLVAIYDLLSSGSEEDSENA